MDPKALIDFLGVLERLKCNTRHSWTSTGRHETVAAHAWRLSMLAWLVRGQVQDVDHDRVLLMCLVHDFGEAVTGDIPAFEKTSADESDEQAAVLSMLQALPADACTQLTALFEEIFALQTREARLFNALDKLEAVLQHNEAPISTWLALEYDLQKTYGVQEASEFPYIDALRRQILRDTEAKIQSEK